MRELLEQSAIAALATVGLVGGLSTLAPEPDVEPEVFVAQKEMPLERMLDSATRVTGVAFRYIDLEEERQVGLGRLPAEHALLEERVRVVAIELLRYPEALRHELVGEILFHDTLYDGDVEWGGRARCSSDSILLSLSSMGAVPLRWKRVLHHEMAHLAFCRPEFPRDGWEASSGPHLGRPPLEELAAGRRGSPLDATMMEQGFLTRYGATSPTEDAAVFAEYLMTAPGLLDMCSGDYDSIRDKRDLLIDFYVGQSPGWDLWSPTTAGRPR